MKRFIIYIVLVLLTSSAGFAQVDRSQYPVAGPAPVINIPEAETFTLENGLKVFVVENHKLPRVTFSLILDRDPILEGDKAGLTSMVGDLMRSGTAGKDKDALDEAIDQIGGRISFSSASASASSLSKHMDAVTDLFTEILFEPSFPEEELIKIKKQYVSALAAAKDDPGSISSRVSNAVLYGKNHPYGEIETEESLNRVTTEDIKDYYSSYFRPSIAYLAIVGDITKAEAERLVKEKFSRWKDASVPKHSWPAAQAPQQTKVIVVDRPASVQSVIKVAYPVDLKYNSPDRIPASVLSYVLGGGSSSRLFLNLREDKGYTYGAYSNISPGKLGGVFTAEASVRTEVTDSAAFEFFKEMKELENGQVSGEELEAAQAYMTGSFARALESPATIASFALNAEIQKLPKDYYKNYLKSLEAVDAAALESIASRYIQPEHAYLIIVGNASDFQNKLAPLGEVLNYTAQGEPVEKKEVSQDVTAAAVLERYIEAIGGKAKVQAIEGMEQTNAGEIQGMELVQHSKVDKKAGKAVQISSVAGQPVSTLLITRDGITLMAMGQQQPVPEELAGQLEASLAIFPELEYMGRESDLTLDGITAVEGEDAYKLVVNTGGQKHAEYYSVSSGLKLKSEGSQLGEILYSDYKEVEGVLFPTVQQVSSPQLPAAMKMISRDIKINPEFSPEDFEI